FLPFSVSTDILPLISVLINLLDKKSLYQSAIIIFSGSFLLVSIIDLDLLPPLSGRLIKAVLNLACCLLNTTSNSFCILILGSEVIRSYITLCLGLLESFRYSNFLPLSTSTRVYNKSFQILSKSS